MINHASLGVRNLARTGEFYDQLFAPMDVFRAQGAKPDEIAFGPKGTPAGLCPFWLYEAAPDATVVGNRTHIAFGVERRALLDVIGARAEEGGATILRRAGLHPDIAEDYYGLIFTDLEGHKIEFVALGI